LASLVVEIDLNDRSSGAHVGVGSFCDDEVIRRFAARSSRSLAALNSRHRRTMTGLSLVDEVIQ